MTSTKMTTVAAIQLDTLVGMTDENLAACQRLAEEAVKQGASWIGFPEFFNTGATWDEELIKTIETEDGPSADFLKQFSLKHSVVIGGSFMCRVPEGGVRNRYLCFSNGELIGRHDKDLPTMWEAAFYEEGDKNDTGYLGKVGNVRVGSAVCWEFIRTQTSARLKGNVDVIMGGSHWWSLPSNWPAWITRKSEAYNLENFLKSVQKTASLTGVPVIHASHCNEFDCKMMGIPFHRYKGTMEGHTAIIDGHGNVLAHREKEQGEGVVIADVAFGQVESNEKLPNQFWLRDRGLPAAFAWNFQGFLGRRWYRKHVKNNPVVKESIPCNS